MIYTTWSNEFGERLEAITGIKSEWFEEDFHYLNENTPNHLHYICCSDNGILPITEVDDKYTGNRIPTITMEHYRLEIRKLFTQPKELFDEHNLKIIDNGFYHYVVYLKDNFNEHKKSLSLVSRHYNKCSKNTSYNIIKGFSKEGLEAISEGYASYWIKKGGEPCHYLGYLYLEDIVDYTIQVKYEGNIICIAYFQVDKENNELYWHQTVRSTDSKYDNLSVGNYVLLKALEDICYPNGFKFNLGLSWFDYKKIWSPELKPIKSVRYK